jgi:hypothetical protein
MHDDEFKLPSALVHRMREVARRLALTFLHEPACWERFVAYEVFHFAWPEPAPCELLFRMLSDEDKPFATMIPRWERDPRFASLLDARGHFLPGARERFDEDYQAMRTFSEAVDLMRVLASARSKALELVGTWGGSPKTAFRYGGRFLALMPEGLVPEQYRADDELTPSS